MSPEARRQSEKVLDVVGGLVATTLLKRGMQVALAPANTNGSPHALTLRSTRARSPAAEAAAYAHGAGWLALVGVAGAHLPIRNPKVALAGGAALGLLVWAAGQWSGRSSRTRGARQIATSLVKHLAYGIAAVTPTALRAAFARSSVATA